MSGQVSTTGWKVIAWNNLGMHCMDADFSVFAILPPYNTIQAHVIDPSGRLVTNASAVDVTYVGVIGMPSAMNQCIAGSNVIAFGVFDAPGMSFPTSPASTGSETPNSDRIWLQ